MILKQYYLGCLAHASYLVADEETKTAVIVDPQRDIEHYIEEAQQLGLDIRHVMLTHFHADFVSGHLELQEHTGAQIHLSARAEPEYEFQPHADRTNLEIGKVRFEFLETPGHTPESMSIVVYDLEKGAEVPHAVLTGDTLFIGDVGRPDLMASVGISPQELAGQLYNSVHGKLLALPDATLVYPAHGAGSMCGKNLSTDTVSTIGEQRKLNYALQPMTKEEFIALVTSDQADAPQYFSYDAVLNRSERQTLQQSLATSIRPLPLEEVLQMRQSGAQIVDTRDPDDYAAGHLAGSTNIGLGGKYAIWAGTLLDREAPIVVIANAGREEEAIMRLGRIGYDQVTGYLEGGFGVVEARGDLVRRTERVTAGELADRLSSSEKPTVLDVRNPGELESGRIEGSIHIPLNHLSERVGEVPRGSDLVVHCAGGYRSSIAVSLLEQHGYTRLADLIGGMKAWEEARAASRT